MTSTEEAISDILEHYGAKGMHWGIRKKEDSAQPKPKKKISSRKEKRAKGHEAKARKNQTKIDQIKANPSTNFFIQKGQAHTVKELKKNQNKQVKAAKDIREGHMTDFQKKAIIGGAVVGGLLLAYGSYKLWNTGAGHQILSEHIGFKKDASLARKMSAADIMEEVVKPINPGFGEYGTRLTHNNCRRASFGYEMRRRGYNVKATRTLTGAGQNAAAFINVTDPNSHLPVSPRGVEKQLAKELLGGPRPLSDFLAVSPLGREPIKGSKYEFHRLSPLSKSTAIFKAIEKHPEGSRGEIGIKWVEKLGGGMHSMSWEVINGEPHIFDGQTGRYYDWKELGSIGEYIHGSALTRLDNLSLNPKYIGKWVQNA